MALSQDTLKNDLLGLFTEARKSPMTEDDYAGRLAGILVKHIRTAAVPAGAVIVSVSGQATGAPNPAEIAVK
jgi:hypothetical protein